MEPWGWILMLGWMVALLVAVWLLVRPSGERPAVEDAMAILRARFARGEIAEDEFERARAALQADRKEFTR